MAKKQSGTTSKKQSQQINPKEATITLRQDATGVYSLVESVRPKKPRKESATARANVAVKVTPCPVCRKKAADTQVNLGAFPVLVCGKCANTATGLTQLVTKWLKRE